jgi:uncharacterized heparinase superfamily protein
VGIAEAEFWRMLPREFARRVRASRRRTEREGEERLRLAVFLANHLVALINKPGMTDRAGRMRAHDVEAMLHGRGGDGSVPPEHSREAFEALMERIYEARRTGTRRVLN